MDDDVITIEKATITDFSLRTVEQSTVAVLGDDVEQCQSESSDIARSVLVLSNFEDPVHGTLETELYVQWVYNFFNIPARDSLEFFTVDSVYIRLPYNDDLVFGDTTQSFSLDVFSIDEPIEQGITINLDDSFQSGASLLLGSPLTVTPNPTLAVVEERINTADEVDTITFKPHVKIPLDPSWAQDFLTAIMDSTNLANDTTLIETFPGMVIRTDGMTDAILGFNGETQQPDGADQFSLQMHYTNQVSGSRGVLSFIPGLRGTGIVHNRIDHDYSGSEAEIALNNADFTDTTLLVGRFTGATTEFTIRDVDIPDNVIINLAELNFTAKELIRTETKLPADNLIYYDGTSDDDGVRDYPSEALSAFNNCVLVTDIFGGDRNTISDEDGNLVNRYTISITDEMQDLVDNTKDSIQLIFTTFPDIDNPRTIRLEGIESGTNPVSLRVLYSTF